MYGSGEREHIAPPLLFVAEAVGRAPNSPLVAEEMQRLTETLPHLWQEMNWGNTHKEAY
jgi:hypothetical protein